MSTVEPVISAFEQIIAACGRTVETVHERMIRHVLANSAQKGEWLLPSEAALLAAARATGYMSKPDEVYANAVAGGLRRAAEDFEDLRAIDGASVPAAMFILTRAVRITRAFAAKVLSEEERKEIRPVTYSYDDPEMAWWSPVCQAVNRGVGEEPLPWSTMVRWIEDEAARRGFVRGFAPHHAKMLLGLGHDLRISSQVARTITWSTEYPDKIRGWAENGLGHGKGADITAILYYFAPLREGGAWWAQVRPDRKPRLKDGSEGGKYLDSTVGRLMVHPLMAERHRAGTATRLLLVEGTNQHLTAVHLYATDEKTLVVGLPSCWGWSVDGKPVADLMEALRPGNVADVLIVLDADAASNRQVNEAGRRLGAVCRTAGKKVRFARLDAITGKGKDGSKDGLDDYVGAAYRIAN